MQNSQDEIKNITQGMVNEYIDRYCKKIKALDCDSDFELNNSVRNSAATTHIMYKLRNTDGHLWLTGKDGRRYEFLVEFDSKDFAYGIYFGCKCILDETKNISHQVKACNAEWKLLKPEVIRALNNTFVDLDFSERDIPTNNVNDNTYWPFWYRLGEEESVEGVAALATKIIRNVYQDFFDGGDYTVPTSSDATEHLSQQDGKMVNTRYTCKAYEEVLKSFDDDIYCTDAKLYFETLIQVLNEENVIKPCRIYEKCWIINNWFNSEFVELIVSFNDLIRAKAKDRVSWKLFIPNFIAANKKPLEDIRRQKMTNKISTKTINHIQKIITTVQHRVDEQKNRI